MQVDLGAGWTRQQGHFIGLPYENGSANKSLHRHDHLLGEIEPNVLLALGIAGVAVLRLMRTSGPVMAILEMPSAKQVCVFALAFGQRKRSAAVRALTPTSWIANSAAASASVLP